MKPRADYTLSACAAELMEIAPLVQPSYRGAVVTYIAGLLTAASETWDEAAHLLVEENRELRVLFATLKPLITGEKLQSEITRHIDSTDDNIRISALMATNDAMRATLIEAHAAIEQIDSPAARAAETAIWSELRRSTERRHHSVDMFY